MEELATDAKPKRRISYSGKTRDWLREQGFRVGTTEHWNAFVGRRFDLFGFIDLVAIRPNEIVGVQASSASGHSARRNKILESDDARAWLEAGGKTWIITWRKAKLQRGGKATRWVHRLEEITIEDYL